MGSSINLGFGRDKSSSRSSMSQELNNPFAQKKLRERAGKMWTDQRKMAHRGFKMMPEMEQNMQNTEFNAGLGMKNQLQGGMYGNVDPVRDSLYQSFARTGGQSNAGRMYQDIIGGAGNTYIDPMVDAMRTGSFENLDRANAGNALNATEMGQAGSSRHAMENAMNNRGALQDMNMNEMNMRGNAYDTDLNWKMGIANQADTNTLAAQNNMMNYIGGANSAQQAGMAYAPHQQNLGMGRMAPWMQAQSAGPWQNMQNYANVIGNDVLTSGTSRGKGSGFNIGIAGSESAV